MSELERALRNWAHNYANFPSYELALDELAQAVFSAVEIDLNEPYLDEVTK